MAATLAAAMMMLASLARWGLVFAGRATDDDRGERANPLVLLLTVVLAPLAATLIQTAISRAGIRGRRRRGEAGRHASHGLVAALRTIESARLARPLPANSATAHLFIINPLTPGGMMALFSTHPPTAQRIARLLGEGPRAART